MNKHEGHEGHDKENGSLHGIKVNAKILKITGWLTGIYFIIELYLGFYSGSIAVISDAFHTFSAVGGILIAFIANKISSLAANTGSTYGYKRAEIMGALLNGVFLFFMALYVMYMGYSRFGMEFELPTGIMLLAAFGGLITEVISFKLIYKSQKNDINMKGAYWHIMQTFVGSILIIVAAVVIFFTGYTPIDAILGMGFGVVLLWVSYKIIKEALDIFMQNTPKDIDIKALNNDLLEIKGIIGVKHMHAWILTSNKNILSAHLQVKNHNDDERILNDSEKVLKEKYGFYFSTLQLEENYKQLNTEEIEVKI